MSSSNANETERLSTIVELQISAKDLINKDVGSKSDPVCVLYMRDKGTHEFVEYGRTEQLNDNLNPVWQKKFTIEYRFEERQELRFAVYDYDGAYSLAEHDYLGSLSCSLGEIVSAPESKFERPLELPKKLAGKTNKSTIIISCEELGANKETFQMVVAGKGLDKKDLFGKSDPFLIISKATNDEKNPWSQVVVTEVVKKTLDPEWRPIASHTAALTGRNPQRKLKFQVFDHDNDGKHDLIGEFETTFQELKTQTQNGQEANMALINPKKKDKKKSYKNSGTLVIKSLKVDDFNYSFLDYIQNGLQLHFTVAVDFTASNGSPNDPKSLHCRIPNQDNQYTLAIKAVGSIIEDYDTDKLFPALGFGARIPPNTEVSHQFFLNFDPKNPFCKGVDGVLNAYQHALSCVKLSGPTHFAPVVNHVAHFANSYQDGLHYFILLILTDGMICDIAATTEAIVNASGLPLSIIIVGVGDEDFTAMEFLDGDKRKLTSNGKEAERDIVQFIAMRDFLAKHGEDQFSAKQSFAQAVLAEVPDQVMTFLKAKKK